MPELLESWGPSPHYDVDIEFPVGVCAWPCLTPALDMECHSLISRHPAVWTFSMELGEGGKFLEDSRFKSSRPGQLERLAKW